MIAVCLKCVDHRPDVDVLTGEVRTDPRTSGASDADRAALEWALRLGEAWDQPVVALCAGPPSAEPLLREALASGASQAVRVPVAGGASSEAVAAAVAAALPSDVEVVLCGAWSLDRGSGSVPAFLAAHLHAAQALGLIGLDFEAVRRREVRAERRLDGGRRERLRIPVPAVLSVEGGSARLRRAPLDGVLRARTAPIAVAAGHATAHGGALAAPGGGVRTGPFRPRARVLPPPSADLSPRERVLALTGALTNRTPPMRLVLGPAEAADQILAQLRAWGCLLGSAPGDAVGERR